MTDTPLSVLQEMYKIWPNPLQGIDWQFECAYMWSKRLCDSEAVSDPVKAKTNHIARMKELESIVNKGGSAYSQLEGLAVKFYRLEAER